MKRYFYREPLDSAYMMKIHGMKFACAHKKDSCYSLSSLLAMGAGIFNTRPPGKIFIHPESLHLLEPQVGDLLNSGEVIRNSIAVATLNDLERCGVRIIQHNGIPFMWPETEEV